VRVAGKDARDLVFAGPAGLVRAAARDGFRPAAAPPGSDSRSVEVADVDNSGELDFVLPHAVWFSEKGSLRKTPLPGGDRALVFDYDSDGDLDVYLSAAGGDRLLRNNLDGSWTDVTSSALPAGTASGSRPRARSRRSRRRTSTPTAGRTWSGPRRPPRRSR
jgi:hypothetical protein